MRRLFPYAGVAALLACGIACAQTYPVKPIRFILPFPPGGGTDTLARIVGQKLGENLGQTIVMDNRPGAGANIGAEIAAHAVPDGYTLLMGNIAHAVNMTLYTRPGYDLSRDFAPITLLAATPNILVVHPSVAAKSVQELIALAKAKPGQLNYASSGSGSSAHLAGELFKSLAGVDLLHIPYKGGGPAVISLVGGEAEAYCHVAFVMNLQGKREDAARAYQQALAKEPNMPKALAALAQMQVEPNAQPGGKLVERSPLPGLGSVELEEGPFAAQAADTGMNRLMLQRATLPPLPEIDLASEPVGAPALPAKKKKGAN